ncbi:MAG: methyltransferase domain-containing protein [Chitinophagaceae bacterium]|nr:methyltransferase domain-containing protein [Chitinophagaceae bacterium]
MPDTYVHDPEIHRTKDAELIVPVLMELFNPKSVLDIGCGPGAFLKVFEDNGITDLKGIEGSWLDQSKLLIDKDRIVIADIEKGFTLQKKFDIAICLEVAEHIRESYAGQLVTALTTHSDVIIFSAAIPAQGGQNHVNEQWIGYWRDLFAARGFMMYDMIRPRIWEIKNIYWWYRQNMVVCINSSVQHKFENGPVYNYIHPELYVSKIAELHAYRQWIDKIFSGQIDVEIAEAILANAKKAHSSPTSTEDKHR